jgi:hypothetical protein
MSKDGLTDDDRKPTDQERIAQEARALVDKWMHRVMLVLLGGAAFAAGALFWRIAQ